MFSIIFAVIWNVLSSFVWFDIPEIAQSENKLALLFLMFPAAGVGLIFWALRNFARYIKFEVPVFETEESSENSRIAEGPRL